MNEVNTLNDTTFRMVNITKVYIQFPGEKSVPFIGIDMPVSGDGFIADGKTFVVETRIFDPASRSMTIILREVVE